MQTQTILDSIAELPRIKLARLNTPFEEMPRLRGRHRQVDGCSCRFRASPLHQTRRRYGLCLRRQQSPAHGVPFRTFHRPRNRHSGQHQPLRLEQRSIRSRGMRQDRYEVSLGRVRHGRRPRHWQHVDRTPHRSRDPSGNQPTKRTIPRRETSRRRNSKRQKLNHRLRQSASSTLPV